MDSNIILARLSLTPYMDEISMRIDEVFSDYDIGCTREVYEEDVVLLIHERVSEMKIPASDRLLFLAEIGKCFIEVSNNHGAELKPPDPSSYDDEYRPRDWDEYNDESD